MLRGLVDPDVAGRVAVAEQDGSKKNKLALLVRPIHRHGRQQKVEKKVRDF